MKARIFFIWGLLAFLAMVPQSGNARPICGDRAGLLKTLTDKYKETLRARALSTSGKAMFEIYTSESGSWTIVMTTTTGVTCLMAAGKSWEEYYRPVGEET